MKKAMSLALAALMLMGTLTGCGSSNSNSSDASNTNTDSNAAETTQLDYPKKDIQIIIPYAPGGGSDNLVRGMMQYLDLGATTVAINVDGASGYIGALQGYNSKNDGYTIMTHNEMDLISYSMSGQATEQTELKTKVSEGRKRLSDEVQLANDAKQWVEAIQEYANITELDVATLNRLIKEIVVHERIDEDKTRHISIEIHFNLKPIPEVEQVTA